MFVVESDSTHEAVAVVCFDLCLVFSPVHFVEMSGEVSIAFIFESA